MLKMIWNIAKAELQMLFYSPVAWLLLIVFSVQASTIFAGKLESFATTQEMGYTLQGMTSTIFAGWGSVLVGIQGYLYFYIPLLTMGLVSRDLSNGSIKLLYSSPITNFQIIIGKYLSVMLYGLLMMAVLVVLLLCGLFVVKDFDWPMVLTGILGLYLLLCAYAAIGIFMSSLTSYQIVAALGTLIVLMLLNMVGNWGQEYDFVRNVTYWLSIRGRCDTFISGMICSEDVLYFIIVVCLFLALTIIRLNAVRQKIRFAVTLGRNIGVILLACVLGYFSSMPKLKGYFDTTATKVNTLTPNSQEIIAKMKGGLTITTYVNVLEQAGAWYASGSFLLPDMQRFEQYTRFKPEIKMKYVYYYDTCNNPMLDQRFPGMTLKEKFQEMCKYGIDSNKVKTPEEIRSMIDLSGEGNTFVRLVERESGEKTWLRVYNDIMRFPSEREISAAFKRLVMKLPVVGILTGHGEREYTSDKDRDYRAFTADKTFRYALINQGFDVEYVTLDNPIREDINILVIAENRESLTSEEEAMLQRYIDRGGNLFILGEPRRREVMAPLFAKFGFEQVEGQLVKQDTNLHPDVILSYPTVEADSIAYEFGYMRLGSQVLVASGVSGLRQVADKGYKVTEVFKSDTIGSWNEVETTDFVDDTIRLNPAAGEVERSYSTIVALSREINGKEQRILLSGDADYISNGGLSSNHRGVEASNFSLVTGGFFWLSNDEVPIDVRRPALPDNYLRLGITGSSVMWWILCVVLPVAMAGMGIFSWLRRKGR